MAGGDRTAWLRWSDSVADATAALMRDAPGARGSGAAPSLEANESAYEPRSSSLDFRIIRAALGDGV
jgi:hypothetical protein